MSCYSSSAFQIVYLSRMMLLLSKFEYFNSIELMRLVSEDKTPFCKIRHPLIKQILTFCPYFVVTTFGCSQTFHVTKGNEEDISNRVLNNR